MKRMKWLALGLAAVMLAGLTAWKGFWEKEILT